MFAVVNYLGKQFKLEEGREYLFPLDGTEENQKVKLSDVVAVFDDKKMIIGKTKNDLSVDIKVLKHEHGKKIDVTKFHSKKRYKRLGSHRQDHNRILVEKINIAK